MALDFLSAILPTQGKYCVFTLYKNTPRKTVFVSTLDNVHDTAMQFSEDGLDAYHALATFDDAGQRRGANALYVRSIYIDLDCGDGKAFPDKPSAIAALKAFMKTTGLSALGKPTLIDSGGGIHAYLPLSRDVPIEEWLPVADAVKRAAKALEFPIDETVTADSARVLRTPGSLNYKYNPPALVHVVMRGGVFNLEDIAECVKDYVVQVRPVQTALMIPGNRPNAVMSPVAKALAGNSSTLFKNIWNKTREGTGCQQIKHFAMHAKDDGMEPMWRAMLSITKHCDDGEKASRFLSAMHPYDEDRMQKKLGEILGPYSCVKIETTNTGGCAGCPHQGKITNPLALGRIINIVEEETVVQYAQPTGADEEVLQRPTSYVRPTPPRGFGYGQNGGLFYRKPGEKPSDPPQEVILTPYDFFMTQIFRDGTDHTAEFVAVKDGVYTAFGIPTEYMGSPKEITRVLAKNNVIATGGNGCDAYLANFVRSSFAEASSSGKLVVVPPHLGWQPDNSFAVGDTMYSPRSRSEDYTFQSASDGMGNVIAATQPKGTLENWQKVMNMMIQKAAREPIVWGHVASALIGFASPLLRFAPAGSGAVTLHICNKESGAGKSLASNLANSVWGKPTGGLMLGNKTSETTMMQRAGLLHSIHLNVDEVTDKNRKSKGEWLPNFLYDFSHGAHKVKGSNVGNTEIAQNCTWSSFAIVTSNDPQLEAMMGAREHSSNGESRRFLEWKMPRNWKIQWTEIERQILSLLNDNYGVAGRKFIIWVQQNLELAESVYRKVESNWRKDTRADDNERFWTNGDTAILTAAILLGKEYANILEVPLKPVYEHLFGLTKDMRAVIRDNITNAMDLLNAYTREHASNFTIIDCSINQSLKLAHVVNTVTRSKGAIRGRIEYEIAPGYTDYYIEIKMLKLHCAMVGHSYLDFHRELSNTPGVSVDIKRKDLLAHTNGPSLRVNCLKIRMETKDVDTDITMAQV